MSQVFYDKHVADCREDGEVSSDVDYDNGVNDPDYYPMRDEMMVMIVVVILVLLSVKVLLVVV